MDSSTTPARTTAAAAAAGGEEAASPSTSVTDGGGQSHQPITHQLTFSTVKPPLFPDHHRFSKAAAGNTGPAATDHQADCIVAKSSPFKQKSRADYNEVESDECTEGRRTYGSSRVTKINKSGPQTPAPNAGSSSLPIQISGSRSDSSLAALTKRFVHLIKHEKDGILDLTKAAETLKVMKRRIYDVSNVLEGIGLIEKKQTNTMQWKGINSSTSEEASIDRSNLKAEIGKLYLEEQQLDGRISEMQEKIRNLTENENTRKWLFVTEEDLKSLPSFQNEILIAIKAPRGTKLEVPYPHEADDYPQSGYRIILTSTTGPIDVYLVSQYEEIEGMNVKPPMSLPIDSTPGPNDNPATERTSAANSGLESEGQPQDGSRMCSDVGPSQDYGGGMMKLLSLDINTDEEYWLLSGVDISMTEMWKTEADANLDGGSMLNELSVADVIPPWLHTRQSSDAEVPSSDTKDVQPK